MEELPLIAKGLSCCGTLGTAKQAFRAYILPRFKDVALSDIGTKELTVFHKGLAVKTARNIIGASFRTLFRDARVEIGNELEVKDPFIDIQWPKVKREPPNPLNPAEKQ